MDDFNLDGDARGKFGQKNQKTKSFISSGLQKLKTKFQEGKIKEKNSKYTVGYFCPPCYFRLDPTLCKHCD